VILAGYYMAYDHTLQASADGLYLAKILYLQTYVGEDGGYLIGREVDVDILF
jgi:hypothetical protein